MKDVTLTRNEVVVLLQAYGGLLNRCTHDPVGNTTAFRAHKNLSVLVSITEESRKRLGDATKDGNEDAAAREVGAETVEIQIRTLAKAGIRWAEIEPPVGQELIKRELIIEDEKDDA